MKRIAVVVIVWSLLAQVAFAQSAAKPEPFRSAEIVLYNPTDDFEARGPSGEITASFIKQLQTKAAVLLKDDKPGTGRSGLIAAAIRPDGTMKLWLDIDGEFQPGLTQSLEREMKSAGVPPVMNGPIAFAVHFDLWGGSTRPRTKSGPIELPQSWQKCAKGQNKPLRVPDDILPLVWKTEPSSENQSTTSTTFFVPEGYELQELSPLGGRMLRPKGWFYTENHNDQSLMWTV